jgi:hypothetical protein
MHVAEPKDIAIHREQATGTERKLNMEDYAACDPMTARSADTCRSARGEII